MADSRQERFDFIPIFNVDNQWLLIRTVNDNMTGEPKMVVWLKLSFLEHFRRRLKIKENLIFLSHLLSTCGHKQRPYSLLVLGDSIIGFGLRHIIIKVVDYSTSIYSQKTHLYCLVRCCTDGFIIHCIQALFSY